MIYLARATVFGGEVRTQGLGLDARRYGGKMVLKGNDWRLLLTYDGNEESGYAVDSWPYEPRIWRGKPAVSGAPVV